MYKRLSKKFSSTKLHIASKRKMSQKRSNPAMCFKFLGSTIWLKLLNLERSLNCHQKSSCIKIGIRRSQATTLTSQYWWMTKKLQWRDLLSRFACGRPQVIQSIWRMEWLLDMDRKMQSLKWSQKWGMFPCTRMTFACLAIRCWLKNHQQELFARGQGTD